MPCRKHKRPRLGRGRGNASSTSSYSTLFTCKAHPWPSSQEQQRCLLPTSCLKKRAAPFPWTFFPPLLGMTCCPLIQSSVVERIQASQPAKPASQKPTGVLFDLLCARGTGKQRPNLLLQSTWQSTLPWQPQYWSSCLSSRRPEKVSHPETDNACESLI